MRRITSQPAAATTRLLPAAQSPRFRRRRISIQESIYLDRSELTPPYVRYLSRLVRPFPNFDFFFMKSPRRRAVDAIQLKPGSRVLDVGCGTGGCFPYLVEAVGPSGEVVGVDLSPEMTINAKRRIDANRWSNVRVVEADARSVPLIGTFDGMVMFAAPDIYASPQALANLFPYLKPDAHVVAFGAKLSHRRAGVVCNRLLRSLMKLSFTSTPELNHEPWSLLEARLVEVQVMEYFFGCMFLAWGAAKTPSISNGNSAQLP